MSRTKTKIEKETKPKHKEGSLVYYIDQRNLKVVQGRVEESRTIRTSVHDEVNTQKVVGVQITHQYKLQTKTGMQNVSERELYSNIQSVSLAFTKMFLQTL